MKNFIRSAILGTTVGAIGLVGCDASKPPPQATLAQPVAPEAIPPSETLVSVVRGTLSEIVRDPDPYAQARRLGTLLPTLAASSVPAVTETLKDPAVDLRSTAVELLVAFWATHEPEAAARWAAFDSQTNYRSTAVFAALSAWAQVDPKKAVEVTWDWSDVPGIETIVPIALVRGWYARNDPPDLRQYLRTIPADVLGQRAMAAYVWAVIETQGSAAVQRWAESLPAASEDDKAYKLMVFRRVIGSLARIDVKSAIAWCDIHCSGPYGSNMRSLIGRTWAWYDGPAALAWLETQKPGTERDVAVQHTYALWSRNQREAAMAWMAEKVTKQNGEMPDWLQSTLAVYARLVSGERPEEAIKWAGQIKIPRDRENVTIGVARVWRSMDEAAAEAWLAQSWLSEEAREKARSPAPSGP